jgi:hypothetical protein
MVSESCEFFPTTSNETTMYCLNVLIKNIAFVIQIANEKFNNGQLISDDIYALSCKPHDRVRSYTRCTIGGVQYRTVDREQNIKTRNNRVMAAAAAEYEKKDIDFYGCLKEICWCIWIRGSPYIVLIPQCSMNHKACLFV